MQHALLACSLCQCRTSQQHGCQQASQAQELILRTDMLLLLVLCLPVASMAPHRLVVARRQGSEALATASQPRGAATGEHLSLHCGTQQNWDDEKKGDRRG